MVADSNPSTADDLNGTGEEALQQVVTPITTTTRTGFTTVIVDPPVNGDVPFTGVAHNDSSPKV